MDCKVNSNAHQCLTNNATVNLTDANERKINNMYNWMNCTAWQQQTSAISFLGKKQYVYVLCTKRSKQDSLKARGKTRQKAQNSLRKQDNKALTELSSSIGSSSWISRSYKRNSYFFVYHQQAVNRVLQKNESKEDDLYSKMPISLRHKFQISSLTAIAHKTFLLSPSNHPPKTSSSQ